MALEAGTRARRVAEGIREELALLLARDVRDPRAAGAVVTRVEVSADLRVAVVHVRCFASRGDTPPREMLGALRRASGMLRREVTRRLGLRYAPELRFAYDDGMDPASHIERLLSEIEHERRGRSS